jgi:TonB-dependent Receptor Plug Domain
MYFLKHNIILFYLFLLVSLSAKATDDPKLKYILEKFKTYNENHYNQKVYLQTDKDTYLVGENVWFSAYIFNGTTLKPDSISGILNFEFINLSGLVTHSQLVKIKNGFGSGQLLIHDTVPDGYYLIRAYTNFMKNFPDNMVFNKIIRVYNDSINYRIYHNKIKKAQQKIKKDITVSFHFNNQKFVKEIDNECRFLVYNLEDNNASNKAYLYDNDQKLIQTIELKHGSGNFNIIPIDKEKYYVKINDLKKKFYLPKAENSSFLIKTNKTQNQVSIQLLKTPDINLRSNLYIVGHNNQKVFFSKVINEENFNENINVKSKDLVNGLNKFVLYNGQYEILAEQCVFHETAKENEIKVRKENFNDSLKITIQVPDGFNRLSISIVDSENHIYTSSGLKTNLFLLSESLDISVKNKLLLSNNINFNKYVNYYTYDLISKNNYWKKVFSTKKPNYKFDFEKQINISGTIVDEKLKYPVANAHVTLSILNEYYDKLSTLSSDKGKFAFYNLNYYDSIDVKIVARKDDKKNVYIDLDETTPYEVKYFPQINNPVLNDFVKPTYTNLNALYEQEQEQEQDTTNTSKIYKSADNVVYIKEGNHYRNIFEAIKGKVPGVVVNNNDVLIRGRNSLYGGTDPLYLIDGVPTSKEAAGSVSMTDVDRIEIIKGSQSNMFGARGSNGIIAIYTKRGFNVKRGELTFQMLGYIYPKKFILSNINDNLYKKYNVSKTVHWNPDVKIVDNKYQVTIPKSTTNYRIKIEGLINTLPISFTEILNE